MTGVTKIVIDSNTIYECGICNKVLKDTDYTYCPYCGDLIDWNNEVIFDIKKDEKV